MSHYDQALELVRADIERLEPGCGTGSAAYLSLYSMLFLIVCASPRARCIGELVSRAQSRGWTVCVIHTPQALKFID
jgi:hypothetical protein